MPRFLYKNFYIILFADFLMVAFSWYFSYQLRFNFELPEDTAFTLWSLIPLIITIKLLCYYLFELYNGMWRYTSLIDFLAIFKACSASSIIIILIIMFFKGHTEVSRSVFIIDWLLTLLLISGIRFFIRFYFWAGAGDESRGHEGRKIFSSFFGNNRNGKRLLILGAGDCGEKICREIHDNPHLGYRILGFLDDDPLKLNRRIHGIPVVGNTKDVNYFTEKLNAEEILIAMPSLSSRDMRKIIGRCEGVGVPFKTIPGMGELINGKVTVKAIRDISYRDLLGRDPVKLDEEQIGSYLKGKRVLITGAGGSIGSELCRQVCRYLPKSVVLFERAESPLYEIDLELKENFQYIKIIPKLSDILDTSKIEKVFEETRPNVVFHAAAYKHVPMLEYNPWEAINNNIIGTRNVVEAAKRHSVEHFVLVSTDKAVRPANVMGASKRLAELLVQSQNGWGKPDRTKFMMVRFGNVIGSVGSVVPLFKRQIEKGGPVTVTHPEMTRYFMTIPEACQLILQAGSMGTGGEIFILDMGVPIKISDMAEDLIRLSGFKPHEDIPIKFIGLRPGEKLKEELITEGEGIVETSHEKIMVLKGQARDISILNGKLDRLLHLAAIQDKDGIKRALQDMLPEYNPGNGNGSLM
ncbi:MAG: polysaccharide biosynthesis protein [Deltaproteobacteria bacterium]|nr:polysaccharide biosynthesis protein [Deltaproteobacteria bacterium]